MICKPCRAAADLAVDDGRDRDALAVELAQRELHDRCAGSTHCACQHRVAGLESAR